MRRIIILLSVFALVMTVAITAWAIDSPISYLERDPTDGRFSVVYDAGSAPVVVSSIDALTAPAISPDGSKIAFSGALGDGSLGRYAIYIVNVDGSGLARLTQGQFGELDPAWSPDGETIYFSRNQTGSYDRSSCCRLAKVDVASGEVDNVTGANGVTRPEVAPSGDLIAYQSQAGIFTVAAAGGTSKLRLAGGSHPSFSHDGENIVYVDEGGSSDRLRSLHLASGGITTLYQSSRRIEAPSWVENRIYFVEYSGAGYDGRTNVVVRSVDSSGGSSQTEVVGSAEVVELDVAQPVSDIRIPGDFDRDGRTDLAYLEPGASDWTIWLSDGTGFDSESWASGLPNSDDWVTLPGDFTGDGRTDLLNYSPGNGTFWVSRSTGSGFSTSRWAFGWPTSKNWVQMPGDFNGDGLMDVASYSPVDGTLWVSRSTGSGFSITRWYP